MGRGNSGVNDQVISRRTLSVGAIDAIEMNDVDEIFDAEHGLTIARLGYGDAVTIFRSARLKLNFTDRTYYGEIIAQPDGEEMEYVSAKYVSNSGADFEAEEIFRGHSITDAINAINHAISAEDFGYMKKAVTVKPGSERARLASIENVLDRARISLPDAEEGLAAA